MGMFINCSHLISFVSASFASEASGVGEPEQPGGNPKRGCYQGYIPLEKPLTSSPVVTSKLPHQPQRPKDNVIDRGNSKSQNEAWADSVLIGTAGFFCGFVGSAALIGAVRLASFGHFVFGGGVASLSVPFALAGSSDLADNLPEDQADDLGYKSFNIGLLLGASTTIFAHSLSLMRHTPGPLLVVKDLDKLNSEGRVVEEPDDT